MKDWKMRVLFFAAVAVGLAWLGFFWNNRPGINSEAAGVEDSLRAMDAGSGLERGELTTDKELSGTVNVREAVGTGSSTYAMAATEQSIPPTEITVTIVEAVGGEAIPDAPVRIQLFSGEGDVLNLEANTGADGIAEFISIDAVQYPGAEVSVASGEGRLGIMEVIALSQGVDNRLELRLGALPLLAIRVVEAISGKPLGGAKVHFTEEGKGILWEASVGPDGTLEHAWDGARGPFELVASLDGYAPIASVRWKVPPGGGADCELQLQRAGELHLSVVDGAGQDLSGLEVHIDAANSFLPRQTASAGELSWETVVAESHQSPMVISGLPKEVWFRVMAKYADSGEIIAWTKIPYGESFTDLQLEVEAASETLVSVIDAFGSPIGGARVGCGEGLSKPTDSEGHALLSSAFLMQASEVWGFQDGYAMAWRDVPPDGSSIVLVLERESVLSGVVLDQRKRPKRYVQLIPVLDEDEGLGMSRGRTLMKLLGAGMTLRTGKQGEFRIGGLQARTLDLYVRPPKAPRFVLRGIAPVEGLVVDLPSEEDFGDKLGVAFDVTVLDDATGLPIEGATVSAFRFLSEAEPGSSEGRNGNSDEHGVATLRFAREGIFSLEVSAKDLLPGQVPRTNYPVGRYQKTLRLKGCGALSIEVVDAVGLAASSVYVSAEDENGASIEFRNADNGASWSRSVLLTDATGMAQANKMPAGALILKVWRGSGPNAEVIASKHVEIGQGMRSDAIIQLP